MFDYRQDSPLDFSAVLALYESVGWTGYTSRPAMLEQALAHSLLVLAVYDGERLIALLRAVGDGFSLVFLQDILVHPDYQRQGIGRELMTRFLAKYPDYYQIHLLTSREEKTKSFYEAVGFTAVEELDCVAYTYCKR